MSSKVRSIKRQATKSSTAESAEANALKTLAAERDKRQRACAIEVGEVLNKHNCTMLMMFQIGEQQIPVGKLVTIPHRVVIVSK